MIKNDKMETKILIAGIILVIGLIVIVSLLSSILHPYSETVIKTSAQVIKLR